MMIYQGACLKIMPDIPDCSIDTIITDPPYALEFMGKGWDKVLPGIEIWRECLRIAKPGAMLIAFGGTRTYHRLTCSIEDAGWQIRDCVMWVYGSGFPKSLNIGKVIDKLQGNKRKVIGKKQHAKKDFKDNLYAQDPANRNNEKIFGYGEEDLTKGSTEWEGYGTALKPSYEPIVLAMKPLDGTFAQNALKWGVGGLWIDGGRVEGITKTNPKTRNATYSGFDKSPQVQKGLPIIKSQGRWPANIIHDGSDEVVGLFPVTENGYRKNPSTQSRSIFHGNAGAGERGHDDSGSAARFFYCAKASRAERNAGLTDPGPQFKHGNMLSRVENTNTKGNNHPTVKPLALMEYLCKLTMMPDGGTVLDPFMGSGTTGIACKNLNRNFIGIEKDPEYFKISQDRIENTIPLFQAVSQ